MQMENLYLLSMILKSIFVILAVCGVPLGAYLMVLAFSTKLNSPDMNGIVIISGFVMSSGCGLYLIIKVVKRLVKW